MKYDEFEKAYIKALKSKGLNTVSVAFSVGEVMRTDGDCEDWEVLVELDQVFAKGKSKFYHNEYTSETIKNPTWLDVIECAEKCMRINRQIDHRFLEAANLEKEKGGTKFYHLWFGS